MLSDSFFAWGLLVACVLAAALLTAAHYSPLGAWARRWQIVGYISGTVCLAIPILGLLAMLGDWYAIIIILAVTTTGGLSVMAWYAIDHTHRTERLINVLRAEKELLRHGEATESR